MIRSSGPAIGTGSQGGRQSPLICSPSFAFSEGLPTSFSGDRDPISVTVRPAFYDMHPMVTLVDSPPLVFPSFSTALPLVTLT